MDREFLVVSSVIPQSTEASVLRRKAQFDEVRGVITSRCAAAGIGVREVFASLDGTDATEGVTDGCELALVLGGDGTFLRAAELAYPTGLPLIGVNLGHVGFLAEAESEGIDIAVAALIDRKFAVEDRMTLDATVRVGGEIVDSTWALNEVSIQNSSLRGVLELITEVEGRPVSSFGADGILVATPTGSTAYAFSAGGPVMWPDLEAILMVPNNAHALFARAMVTSPHSPLAIEVVSSQGAVAVCDGRRQMAVPQGGRVEIVRGDRSVKWITFKGSFADRLVRKFNLPVTGWRGI